MALTLEDLKEKLIRVDEISLLEILNISSEEIVERLSADFEEDKDDSDAEWSDSCSSCNDDYENS
jgi:hypothetical protein